jgi:hypothetical protein
VSLSAVGVSTTSINLTATYVGLPNIASYTFWQWDAAHSAWVVLTTQAGATYAVNGLTISTTYRFMAAANTVEVPSRQTQPGFASAATLTSGTGVAVPDPVLRAAGYILVTDYGAVADGTTDSTTFIQNAINAANTNFKPLWFSIDVTGQGRPYIISKTLTSYVHFSTGGLGLQQVLFVGATVDPVSGSPARPKLKIASGATWFNSVANYEPMLCIRTFTNGGNGQTWPGDASFDPLTTPANWAEDTGNHGFGGGIIGIDFDTNQNPGGCGFIYTAAQSAHIQNVTITATNSFAGTIGLPVEGSGVVNLQVIGGQYGVYGSYLRGIGSSPSYVSGFIEGHITGLTCIGQTVACISTNSFMSSSIVGFDLQPAAGAVTIQFGTGGRPSENGLVMVDGKVTMATTAAAFVNTGSPFANLNLHNVYIFGTNTIVNIGGGIGATGLGTAGNWQLINDYHLATNSTVFDGTHNFLTDSIIYAGGSNSGGSASLVTGAGEHYTKYTADTTAPPADLISRHLFTMPQIDTGTYIDITAAPYNCVPATTTADQRRNYNASTDGTAPDCRVGLQAAIDAAASGNGRVFLPVGSWCVGTPGLVLKSNTVLFGAGQSVSQIIPNANWVPTTGTPPVVDTVSDTEATTQFVNLMVFRPQTRGTTASYTSRSGGAANTVLTGNIFNGVNWKVGRKSIFSNIYMESQYQSNGYASYPKQLLNITGNGGGRFYSVSIREEDRTNQDVDMVPININTSATGAQPLWIYACNVEFGGKSASTGPNPLTNILIASSSNIRIFQTKREGAAPTVVITGSNNVAHYAAGKMGGGLATDMPSNFYAGSVYAWGNIDTASTNIMLASWTVFIPNTATQKLVYDQASGLSVNNQTQICLYLKGAIDDTVMGH